MLYEARIHKNYRPTRHNASLFVQLTSPVQQSIGCYSGNWEENKKCVHGEHFIIGECEVAQYVPVYCITQSVFVGLHLNNRVRKRCKYGSHCVTLLLPMVRPRLFHYMHERPDSRAQRSAQQTEQRTSRNSHDPKRSCAPHNALLLPHACMLSSRARRWETAHTKVAAAAADEPRLQLKADAPWLARRAFISQCISWPPEAVAQINDALLLMRWRVHPNGEKVGGQVGGRGEKTEQILLASSRHCSHAQIVSSSSLSIPVRHPSAVCVLTVLLAGCMSSQLPIQKFGRLSKYVFT